MFFTSTRMLEEVLNLNGSKELIVSLEVVLKSR